MLATTCLARLARAGGLCYFEGMRVSKLSLCVFVGIEVCLCLVTLGMVLPATLKTGSLLATGAALVSAIPWGLVTATGLAVWRFALRRKP